MNHAHDPIANLAETELAHNYLGYTPLTLIVHLIAASLMLLPMEAGATGELWLACYGLINALRLLVWWGYRGALGRNEKPQPWVNRQAIGLFASGAMWGLAPWLFVDNAPPIGKIYVFAAIVVMAVGTTIANAPFPRARLAYCVPALLLGGVRAIIEGGVQFVTVGAVLLTSVPIIAAFGAHWGRVLQESMRMRHEKNLLIDELTAQKATAERATTAKSQFFAAASHDLRQPLHALGYYAALLDDPARVAGVAPQVQACIQALNNLFEGILDLARLDAGAVEPQRCDFSFAEMIARQRTLHLPLAQEKNLELRWRIDEIAIAYSDPLLVERIVSNILSNAVRHTSQGAILTAVRQRGDAISVTVCDTGPGMSEAESRRVFDEFVQLNNAARDATRGFGLGLPTVRRLATVLGHDLRVRSRPDHGTCFALTLPRGQIMASHVVPMASSSKFAALTGRILILDDHAPSREAMAQMLEQWGLVCDVAASFADAQRLRAINYYHGIFTDFRLPGDIDGLAIARRWQMETPPPKLLCLVSGEARLPDDLPAGIDWLRKPLKPARLRALLISRLETSL
jgi:two-component system, sensor histidine kinase